jgi:transcriptional regulator with XRE-family HTH domain
VIDLHIFGLFLFAKRLTRGKTQRDVAAEAGVRIEAIVRAEERRTVGADQFQKLCAWQGEDPEVFEARGAT